MQLLFKFNFKLEMNIAKQNKDMEAIAHRTQSKLYYLNDYNKCIFHLDKVDKIMETHLSDRIMQSQKVASERMFVNLMLVRCLSTMDPFETL